MLTGGMRWTSRPRSVMAAIEDMAKRFSGACRKHLGPELVGEAGYIDALKQFDERNGGFGSQPKFPHCGCA